MRFAWHAPMMDGDVLQEVRLTDSLALATVFGRIVIDPEGFKTSTTSGPAVTVAVDLRDRSMLSGALNASALTVHDEAGRKTVDLSAIRELIRPKAKGPPQAQLWDRSLLP